MQGTTWQADIDARRDARLVKCEARIEARGTASVSDAVSRLNHDGSFYGCPLPHGVSEAVQGCAVVGSVGDRPRIGTPATVLYMLNRDRLAREAVVAGIARRAVMHTARRQERLRRLAVIEAQESAAVVTPLAALTLDERCTLIERRDGTPWRPTLTSRQHRRRLAVVNGEERRASERWKPTAARERRLADGRAVRSPARTLQCDPRVVARFGWDVAVRLAVKRGATWQPMSASTASTGKRPASMSGVGAADSYSARLARFGAVGTGETD